MYRQILENHEVNFVEAQNSNIYPIFTQYLGKKCLKTFDFVQPPPPPPPPPPTLCRITLSPPPPIPHRSRVTPGPNIDQTWLLVPEGSCGQDYYCQINNIRSCYQVLVFRVYYCYNMMGTKRQINNSL